MSGSRSSLARPLVALVSLFVTGAASAGPIDDLLSPDERARLQPLPVLVSVKLNQLDSRVNPVGLSSVAGGLLPALIDSSIEGSRKDKAADPLQTVRAGMADYDLEKQSIKALAALGERLPWLTVTEVKSVGSFKKPAEVLDRASVPQALIVKYDYWIEPRFDSFQINADVKLVTREQNENSSGAKKRTKNKDTVLFSRYFICFVPLRSPAADIGSNAALWAADGGKVTRESLDLALAKTAETIADALERSEEAQRNLNKQKEFRVGYSPKRVENYQGAIVTADETGTLLDTDISASVYYFWPTQGPN